MATQAAGTYYLRSREQSSQFVVVLNKRAEVLVDDNEFSII